MANKRSFLKFSKDDEEAQSEASQSDLGSLFARARNQALAKPSNLARQHRSSDDRDHFSSSTTASKPPSSPTQYGSSISNIKIEEKEAQKIVIDLTLDEDEEAIAPPERHVPPKNRTNPGEVLAALRDLINQESTQDRDASGEPAWPLANVTTPLASTTTNYQQISHALDDDPIPTNGVFANTASTSAPAPHVTPAFVIGDSDQLRARNWVQTNPKACSACLLDVIIAKRNGLGAPNINQRPGSNPFCSAHNELYHPYKHFRQRLVFLSTGIICFKCGGPYTHLHSGGTDLLIEVLRPLGFCVSIDPEFVAWLREKDLFNFSKSSSRGLRDWCQGITNGMPNLWFLLCFLIQYLDLPTKA
ncbi:hypothetical protein TWF173_000857 [Orbilia oligospora]|nr:hypothetical protein TWF173_000857 [Orbilia oligospora]